MSQGKDKPIPAQLPSKDPLAAQAQMLSKIAVHPAFLALVQEIQYSPESERLATAQRLANVETLRARGIELPPEGFRLTTRYFEDPSSRVTGGVRIGGTDQGVLRASSVTMCASVGFFVCLSVGSTEVDVPAEVPTPVE